MVIVEVGVIQMEYELYNLGEETGIIITANNYDEGLEQAKSIGLKTRNIKLVEV